MENRLPIDTSALSSGQAARLLAYYEAFCPGGDDRHLWLAAHAAFPAVLATDLLYKLWLNFRLDEQGEHLDIPMIAVSDLLLSTLCRPTSRHIFEMPQELRTALLLYLKNHPRFGSARIQRLAHFLRFYLRETPRQLPSRAFAKAQEFTYLAQLDPQKAAEQLLEAWNQQKDKERLRQMLAWSEQQAQLSSPGESPAQHHNPLQVAVQLVRGFQHFQKGQQDKALQELQALKGRAAKAPTDEEGAIRMDIPQAILERLPEEFFVEQEGEKGEQAAAYAKIHFLFHESLDKQKLLRQLFPGQAFAEGQPLLVFHWKPSLPSESRIGTHQHRILFGLKVRQLRQDHGLSLMELSEKTQMSVSYLNEIEKGKKFPKKEKAQILAAALEVSYEELASLDIEKNIGPVSAYNIWAWDSSLPPELDRFALTPGGDYYIITPPREDIAPLLHRIYSQVGQEKVRRLFVVQEEEGEVRFTRYLEGEEGQETVRIQLDFNDVLWGIAEKQSPESIPYVELPDKSLPTQDRDILAKANQAGLLRYEAPQWLFDSGFKSTSPSVDLMRMVETIQLAGQNAGGLSPAQLEEAKKHPIPFELMQRLGLIFPSHEGGAWMPAQMPHLPRENRYAHVPNSYLRYTFDFLPSDLEWRLAEWLRRAGAKLIEIDRPLLLQLYGVPFEIKVDDARRQLEIRVAHVVENTHLASNSVFAQVMKAFAELLFVDEDFRYNYNKALLLLEILSSWQEASFYQELAGLISKWREVIQNFQAAGEETSQNQSLEVYRNTLTLINNTLQIAPSEKFRFSEQDLIEKIIEGIKVIINGDHMNSSVVGTYHYLLSPHLQTLLIPPHATPEMVLVEGGTFQMGSGEYDDEKVTLDSFEIGQFPLTLQEFDAFCEATKREKSNDRGWGRENRPAIYVDWYDAVEYCNWLSEIWGLEAVYKIDKDKKDPNNRNSSDKKKWLVTPNWQANGYRLPSEAEWEYAARGGKHSKEYRYAGSNELDEVGWYSGNSDSKTHPVGLKNPNELGLYDMSGNVWEWCWDWYGSYPGKPQDNPTGPDSGSYRVYRGGSWYVNAATARCSYRGRSTPDYRFSDLGFRLARTGGQ